MDTEQERRAREASHAERNHAEAERAFRRTNTLRRQSTPRRSLWKRVRVLLGVGVLAVALGACWGPTPTHPKPSYTLGAGYWSWSPYHAWCFVHFHGSNVPDSVTCEDGAHWALF